MRKLRKSMLFTFLVAAVVSCGGGGGSENSSNIPIPVNMEVNLRDNLSEAVNSKVESDRLKIPAQP